MFAFARAVAKLFTSFLHLRLHVTGLASESLFNLIANFLGGARNAIVSHGNRKLTARP
jgi:hypothetical protein